MKRIIDLTHTIENGNKVYDANPTCFFNPYQTIARDGYNLTQVILNSHASTHIDAPYHFVAKGLRLDEIPVERLIGEAVLVDCGGKKAKELITLDEVRKYDSRITEGSNVLIRTDWYKTYPGREFAYDMPNIDTAVVRYLVGKKINLLGLEMPSLNWADNPGAHRLLLGANILLVEGLAHLDRIKKERFTFICLPLKLKGLDGFPVRAVAIEE